MNYEKILEDSTIEEELSSGGMANRRLSLSGWTNFTTTIEINRESCKIATIKMLRFSAKNM